MLICSKTRYLPTTSNMVVLKKEDMYFYVHRDVYDKAIILKDRYTRESLSHELDRGFKNYEAVTMFCENAPEPLNSLAPFLALVESGLDLSIEVLTGALHVITSVINVREYMKQPPLLRKQVTFTLSIKEEYELSWDRFFQESMPYQEKVKTHELLERLVNVLENNSSTYEKKSMPKETVFEVIGNEVHIEEDSAFMEDPFEALNKEFGFTVRKETPTETPKAITLSPKEKQTTLDILDRF